MEATQEAVVDTMNGVIQNSGVEGGKFLTFLLKEECYGLEILKVREIIGIIDITPVPQTPEYVKGVINLRGKVIPVVDLRLKFSLEEAEHTNETCIIVVDVENVLMGIVVDTVSEVLNIEETQIEPAPSFGSKVDTDFIMGLGKVNDKVNILLDISQVLNSDELSIVESMQRTADA